MKIAIWIIAICEVVRALQNVAQLMMVHHDTGARDNAYAEFVKSLKGTDEDFVENLLREFEREHGERKDEPQTEKNEIPEYEPWRDAFDGMDCCSREVADDHSDDID